MGLAEKVMSLTFRRNINLLTFRDEFVLKKKSFDERSAHSKAVLDDSLITVDTTTHHLIKGLAKKSHESHNLRIALSTVIFSSVVISLPMT